MNFNDIWKSYLTEADANMPSTTAAPVAQPATPTTQPAQQDAKLEQDAAKKKQDAQKALVDLNTALKAIQTQAANLQQLLAEEKKKKKDDRCTRLAKQKYDKWPSAYASGAVVKCRQGKIWKKK